MPKSIYVFDGWRLDTGRRRLLNPSGVEIELSSTDFDLLMALCQRPQQIIPRKDLIPRHEGQALSSERAVDIRVMRLREKIEIEGKTPGVIKTIRHAGYWFAPDVTVE